MKQQKIIRFAKTIGLICLMFLAGVGMGMTGVAPINLFKHKKKPDEEDQIEMVEKKDAPEEKETIRLEDTESTY